MSINDIYLIFEKDYDGLTSFDGFVTSKEEADKLVSMNSDYSYANLNECNHITPEYWICAIFNRDTGMHSSISIMYFRPTVDDCIKDEVSCSYICDDGILITIMKKLEGAEDILSDRRKKFTLLSNFNRESKEIFDRYKKGEIK